MPCRSHRRLAMETLERRITLTATVGPVIHESLWEQVIVAFRDDVRSSRVSAEAVINPVGGRLGHVYEHSISGFSAQLPAAAVRGLVHHPLIRSVEIDMVMSAHGQVIPTGVSRIMADTSLVGGTIGKGKSIDNVHIAIIDSGIANHPDLNVVGGARFYTVTGGPPRSRGSFEDNRYADDSGHGTHVAGTAAARDNGNGVVGVAPGAPLWAVKVLDSSGNGFMSDIIAGVDWVTERANTISVANMSLGGTGKSDALREAIQRSVNAGIVYTVSAGNGWEDIHGLSKTFNTTDDVIPAAYPEVATIAAFADSDGKPGGRGPGTSWGQDGQDDAWWGPSNFSNSNDQNFLKENPVNSPGLGIDLILPGVDILSTYLNGGFATMSGTSMAAPHAAGLAALHIAANGRRATNAAEVHAIRQALIDNGPAWNAPEGLAVHWGPAAFMANIGWAGNITPSEDPIVAISSPADGAIVWGDVRVTASATVAEGASFVSVDILLGGGSFGEMKLDADNGSWNFTWATVDDEGVALYTDGTYQLTVVATDNAGRSASDSVTVTVNNSVVAASVELSGNSVQVNRNFWRAQVTATVSDSSNQALAGIEVIGRWNYSSSLVSLSTNSQGQVVFESQNLRNNESAEFTVIGVTGFDYEGFDSIRVLRNGFTEAFSATAVDAFFLAANF